MVAEWVRLPLPERTAVRGLARHGRARLGKARRSVSGMVAEWVRLPLPERTAWQGWAELGVAGQGKERWATGRHPGSSPRRPRPKGWLGRARRGPAWRGAAWLGKEIGFRDGRRSGSTPDSGAHGGARLGQARRGWARRGVARQGSSIRTTSPIPNRDTRTPVAGATLSTW
jgi:hypothetical protein